MKNNLMLLVMLWLTTFQMTAQSQGQETEICDWVFSFQFNDLETFPFFVNPLLGGERYTFPAGEDLYVRANTRESQDIEYVELYVNDQLLRRESNHPYEWGVPNNSGDQILRNIQPGMYHLRLKVLDKCGDFHERECEVTIEPSQNCEWDFGFEYPDQRPTGIFFSQDCGYNFPSGHNLYLKARVERQTDIDYIELYVNNQLIRRESNAPYEWGIPNASGDNVLRNMQPGVYQLMMKQKDKCGDFHEKECTVTIDQDQNCTSDFGFEYPDQRPTGIFFSQDCGYNFPSGHNLYLKARVERQTNIDYIELYVNNQLIRRESNAPYEWGIPNASGDNVLRNMQPGVYQLMMKQKDKCGDFHEKECTVTIDASDNCATDWTIELGGQSIVAIDISGYFFPQSAIHYPYGHDLYVGVNVSDPQQVDYVELYMDDQLVRRETNHPFEWGVPNSSGDQVLRDMQPGTYEFIMKLSDKCGGYEEKKFLVIIDQSEDCLIEWGAMLDGQSMSSNGGSSSYSQFRKLYPSGHNLFVEAAVSEPQYVDFVELYIDNQLVRRETNHPYEWGVPNSSGDQALRDMAPGTYEFKMILSDNCGSFQQNVFNVIIDQADNCVIDWEASINDQVVTETNGSFTFYSRFTKNYNSGDDLYVVATTSDEQLVEYIELYMNGQLVRKESNAPYEWGVPNNSGDFGLRNMQPGDYTLMLKLLDNCGDFQEKSFSVRIDPSQDCQIDWSGEINGQPDAEFSGPGLFYNRCQQTFPPGQDLYVIAKMLDNPNVEYVELFVNNLLVRRETNHPYEWGRPNASGDNALRNMQPGLYAFRLDLKDECGVVSQQICDISIND